MTETLQEIKREYEGEDSRPLASYTRVLAAYGGAVGGLVTAAKLTGREAPEKVTVMDLVLMGLFTHRLSRTVAKDPVTSPIRAPFTRYEGLSGPAELKEEVRGHGVRKVVGELLTCPFCLSQWIATGYAAGMVFFPRLTRLAGAAMTAVAISDWLQLAYTRLMKAAE
ncbi:hypothetical protein GCM10010116_56710 [Microbispora rosea subsp. aerata]|nr:DUF1360 domain-containing protein [Microbispora rosea]GGO28305.1 hypothetical protein GCM10010116_56710 [Microbispora rosea subsp. aerata]GIH58733.1 hypothetical protein Mro02_56470 [Microbispora rosea subsp. aerata]GLJ82446.1 hypothetical protein GCM10017588_11710 [Microbispora rosea subsp. aerata]